MRAVPCYVAVILCLFLAGCRMFGKKPAGTPTAPAAGADAPLRADRTAPAPAYDRAVSPAGVNGMLAGQVIDSFNQRTPAAFIRAAELSPAGSPAGAPIEVPADSQGYFTIQGLQVGRRYQLTARARSGSRELTGKTWATAPDPKVLIRISEDLQGPSAPVSATPRAGPDKQGPEPPERRGPADPEPERNSNTPRNGQTDNRVPATGQRRAAELGPPTGLNQSPPRSGVPVVPEPPDRPQPRSEFRPDRSAWDEGLARNEPPNVRIPPWAPSQPAPPPFPSDPMPSAPVDPEFGPARVPSCILTGETLHNFALHDLTGQPWEFRGHRGRVVLIDFWGTWCPHCLHTIPHLNILQDRYGPYGLEVIGIAYEEGPPVEQMQKVNRVRQRLAMNYRVLLADDSPRAPCPVRTQFGVNQWPTLVLLNDRGRIIWRSEGMGPQQLREVEIIIRQQLGMR